MAGKRRGVGYCTNDECAVYGELYLLFDLPSVFECPTCLRPARLEREKGVRRRGASVFDEVRVEFDFDPLLGIYRQTARVRDGRLLGCRDVYTLQSPIVKDRDEAVKIGRIVLENVNSRIGATFGLRQASRRELVAQGWTVVV